MFERIFSKKTKEETFWNWFSDNAHKIYKEDNPNSSTYSDVGKMLRKYQEDLTYEFSPIHNNGSKEFFISADGVKDAFPAVIKLVETAPHLKNWDIIAFRQRANFDFQLEYRGIKVTVDNFYFRYAYHDDGIALELNIKNYEEDDETWKEIGYLVLDSLLGEYDVETKITQIEWVKFDEQNIDNLSPLKDLPDLVDNYFVDRDE